MRQADRYLRSSSTSATFGATAKLVNNGTSTTVTITVTGVSGSGTPESANGASDFAPAPTISDSGSDPATGGFTTSTAFRLF